MAAFILLFAALAFTSGCIGLTGAPKPAAGQTTSPGSASVSVAPASISFGTVAVGGTVSQSVTISNGGGADLTVTQAGSKTAGITISGISLPLVIPAGKQSTFLVAFSPKAAGALSGTVSVMTDASTSPSTVSLSGMATAPTSLLTANASSLSFGSVTVGSSDTRSVVLANAGNSDVTISKVIVSSGAYVATGVSAGLTLAPGQSATLDAKFSPASTGSFAGTITISSNATDSPATISLSGSGSQAGSHSVALTWTPSTSAVAGYNVYRAGSSTGPYAKLDSSLVQSESYTDTGVQAGLTYYYVVTSVSSSGIESADSTPAAATVP